MPRRDTVAVSPVEVDVSSELPFPGRHRLGGRAWVPRGVDGTGPLTLLYCLAGGGCTTGYFDLEPPAGLDGYSMARHLAGKGLVVVALDHPGLGRSTPVDDLFLLTPGVVAAAHAAAVADLRRRLDPGSLVVGVGHSMGGMLVDVQQARHRSFDGIAVLGASGAGVPEVLTDAERGAAGRPDAELVALARQRFAPGSMVERRELTHGAFFAPDVPAAARAAFAAQRAPLLPTCGLTAMVPGATDADKAAIDVPVLLAFGEHDICTDIDGAANRYASAPTTRFELAGSGHLHNLAGRRTELWDRLATFARLLSPSTTRPARCTGPGSG